MVLAATIFCVDHELHGLPKKAVYCCLLHNWIRHKVVRFLGIMVKIKKMMEKRQDIIINDTDDRDIIVNLRQLR